MLTCFLNRRRIGAFLDGELRQAVAETMSHHLARCAGCRSQSRELTRLRAVLSAWSQVAEPDWTGFWPGIVRGIETGRSAPAPIRTRATPWRRRVALAGGMGAVTAGLVAVALLSGVSERTSAPPGGHLVELADTEYPDGVMVYSPPESDMTVIWVFSPEGVAGSAI